MSTEKASGDLELCVVLLADGRKGTVQHVFSGGIGYLVELSEADEDGRYDLIEVTPAQIKQVLWRPGDPML